MYTLYVLAFFLERRYDSRSILMWCAIVFVWINPMTVYSVSFQLSFMATASILWIYPVILTHLLRAEFPGRQFLAVTLAAQLGTWPVIAWHFGTIPLLSLPANLLIVPMLGILMPAGLLMTAVSLLSPTLAGVPAFVVQGGLSYMIRMTGWLNRVPGAVFETESLRLSWVIAYYLLLAGVVKILSHNTEKPVIQNRWMERGMTDDGQRPTMD
jgi:competence protein ComEC